MNQYTVGVKVKTEEGWQREVVSVGAPTAKQARRKVGKALTGAGMFVRVTQVRLRP